MSDNSLNPFHVKENFIASLSIGSILIFHFHILCKKKTN
ncbi:hypothetical protein BAP_2796 [Bacillus sp. CN2]|nr:hypothetical protein BAP_2796 [Bacillus sp. CN2]